MAGQIGSAVLAENSCLKERIFRLEANLFEKETKNDKLKKDETQWIQKVSTLEQKLTYALSLIRKRKVLPKRITGNIRRK